MINRRQFSQAMAGMLAASRVQYAQTPTPVTWAGASIVDCHHHLRPSPEANIAHLDGAGISNAQALARANSAEQMQALEAKYPGRFLAWFASTDITKPEAADLLTKAVKSGATGLGEIKFHVEAAGPELRRMYELAAELNVPILIHFQEVPHTPTEGVFSTGFKNFEAMLKAYPKTKFIGHADAFWANVSADYANADAYPTGPIKRGGVTDKLLADYPESVRRSGRQLGQQRALARSRIHRRFSEAASGQVDLRQRLRAARTAKARGSRRAEIPPPAGWRENAWRGRRWRC